MTEIPFELVVVLPHLAPEQQQILLAILQGAQDQEILYAELAKRPELLAVLQSTAAPRRSSIPVDLDDILHELAQPASSLHEMPHRIELCQQALAEVDKKNQPELWAILQNELARRFWQNPQGSRADNVEQAIAHYQQALEVFTQKAYAQQWANIQINLAVAYGERIQGEHADNLEQTITHFKQALVVFSRESFSEEWARAQYNLATAYLDRVRGDRANNLEQAIIHYKQALEMFTQMAHQRSGLEHNTT